MAGRGCTIIIKLLGGTSGEGETEDISLPVALHSPLQVLKQQLHELVHIAPRDQVLILCDLSDPERNSDRLLTGLDSLSLQECNIRNGSILTLHALGVSAERSQRMMAEAFSNKATHGGDARERHYLSTDITAADADHSYNGIIFDIESTGPYEIEVFSVSIAGMLGRVRVLARDRSWEANQRQRSDQNWWAHRGSISEEGWEVVADRVCRPSWDRPIEIQFTKPLIVPPHSRRGLYCHSGLPDDLGIQYQSYGKYDIVANDNYVRLLPGVGHTGHEPFEEQHGWYRSYRGLAGSVGYFMRWKGWTVREHHSFPVPLRTAVHTMLLCNTRPAHMFNLYLAASTSSNTESAGGALSASAASLMETEEEPSRRPRLTLGELPLHVIYYILEFMHFDWFEEVAVDEKATVNERTRPLEQGRSRFPRSVQLMNQFLSLLGGGAEVDHQDLLQALAYYQIGAHGGQGVDDDDDDDEEYEYKEEDEDDEDDEEEDEEEDEDEAVFMDEDELQEVHDDSDGDGDEQWETDDQEDGDD